MIAGITAGCCTRETLSLQSQGRPADRAASFSNPRSTWPTKVPGKACLEGEPVVGGVGAVGSPAAPAAAGSAGVVAWPRRASGGQDGRARVGGRKVSGRCPGSAGARVAVSRSAGQGGRERTDGGWRRRGGGWGGEAAPDWRHHSQGGAVPGERLQLRRDMRRRKQGRKGRGVLGKWGGDGGGGHLLAARRRRRCRGGGAVGLRQRGLPETVPIQRHRLQPANGYKEWARGASGERALAEQALAQPR